VRRPDRTRRHTVPLRRLHRLRAVPAGPGGERLALAVYETLGEGGSGEYSGAGGESRLELFRIEPDRLVQIGALRTGAMQWLTLRHGEMGSFYRFIARHYAPAFVRGPRCLAIGPREEHFGDADGAFRATRSRPGARDHMPLVAIPDRVALGSPRGVPTELSMSASDDWDDELLVPTLDWTGVYRVERADLVRISRDPDASCDVPAPP
jgi:hypothetical protein